MADLILLFRLKMEYYFIHMPAAAGLIVPYLSGLIFVHFFECMGSYLGYGIMKIGLQMLNCLWFVTITVFVSDIPLEIVQRC